MPHPLYPASRSLIVDASSPLVLLPPTAGRVGSWFGFRPYSSISLRRRSSASFLALRFLKNHKPARTRRETTTIGITTAIAILGPFCSPPPFDELSFEDAKPAATEDEAEAAASVAVVAALLLVGVSVTACMEVLTTVVVSADPPAFVLVTKEVTRVATARVVGLACEMLLTGGGDEEVGGSFVVVGGNGEVVVGVLEVSGVLVTVSLGIVVKIEVDGVVAGTEAALVVFVYIGIA